MNQMGMDESRDAKWIGSKDVISKDEWRFFEENICSNCQKIIVAKYTTFLKINALLRAIRNCIAYSHFAIVEIKSYKGQTYLHPEHVMRFLKRAEEKVPDYEKILLIDTSRVTKSVRQLESNIKDFRIVDINDVKLLLGEEAVDILAKSE